MKKIFSYKNIVSALAVLIFVVAFLFLSLAYDGHFAFWEGNNYWEASFLYFLKCLQPAGLTPYIANFLQMFYQWHYVGCVVLMLPAVVIGISCRMVFKILQLPNSVLPLTLLPVVALLSFLLDKLCFLSVGFYVAWFYLALVIYAVFVNGKSVRRSIVLSFLFYPFLFFLLPSGCVILFYLLLLGADILLLKDAKRSPLILKNLLVLLFAVLVPILWSFLVNKSLPNDIYSFDITLFKEGYRAKVFFFYLLPFLFLLLAYFYQKRVRKINECFVFVISLLAVGLVMFWFSVYEKEKSWERFFCIESACNNRDWDQVLLFSECQKNKIDNLFPYTVIAHAAKGELPQKMFEYPLTAKGVFFPESNLKNINIQANVAFYQACGMLNTAIVYAFQNSSIRTNEYDVLTLKQLSCLNALVGAKNVSEKYLNKLRNTLFYDDFVEEWSSFEFPKINMANADSILFFNSGDKHLELIELLDRQYNPVAADFLLCSLLKMRDSDNFVKYFFKYYPYRECDVLPKAYEEFLVMAPKANIALPNTDFKISEATRKRFEQFLSIYTSNSDDRIKKLQLKSFADTWFYYAVYGK